MIRRQRSSRRDTTVRKHASSPEPQPRSDAADQREISGFGARYGLQGNGPVERGEPAVIPNGQTKQIRIRDLLMTADHRRPKKGLVREGDRIPPEMMVRRGAKDSQAARHFGGSRFHGGICGVTQNTDAAVYRDRACRPTVLPIPAEPAMCVFVIGMGRIEESHQDIHVRKRDAQAPSRNWFTTCRSGFETPALGTKS